MDTGLFHHLKDEHCHISPTYVGSQGSASRRPKPSIECSPTRSMFNFLSLMKRQHWHGRARFFLRLSLSTRHRCVAPIVLRTPITRRAKPPTSDAMIFLPGHDSPMALDTVFVKCISNMHTQKPPVFIVRLQLLQSAICCGNSYIRLSVRLSDVYRWNNLMCAYFETRVVP